MPAERFARDDSCRVRAVPVRSQEEILSNGGIVVLCFQSAIEIAARIRRRELSAVECLDYFRDRVQRT
jgi:hypothetical protein